MTAMIFAAIGAVNLSEATAMVLILVAGCCVVYWLYTRDQKSARTHELAKAALNGIATVWLCEHAGIVEITPPAGQEVPGKFGPGSIGNAEDDRRRAL